MVGYKKDVFATVGLCLFDFCRGKPFDIDLLRREQQRANCFHLHEHIDSHTYEEICNILETVEDFMS